MPGLSSNTTRTKKKPRKKPRPPQLISMETWKAIELAIVAGGLGYSETGRKFGVSPYAIMMKARRHGWAVPSKIAERTKALQARYKSCESNRNANEEVIQTVAESWAERGEQHRFLAFQLANAELLAASKRGLPIEDWSGAEKADRMARKACGLDSEEGARISIGMALVNDRLEALVQTLPKQLD